MAAHRAFLVSLLLLLFALDLIESRPVLESNTLMSGGIRRFLVGETAMDCGGACQYRCSRSSRPNLCKRACGTCCTRCNCVPPGTYGNYGVCPCYAAMTTRGGKRKCP